MLATDDKTLWIGQGREFAKLDIDNGSITSLFTLPEQFENAFVRTLFHYNGYIFIGSTDGAYVFNIATQQVRPLEYLSETDVHIYQKNVKSFALGNNNQCG